MAAGTSTRARHTASCAGPEPRAEPGQPFRVGQGLLENGRPLLFFPEIQ